MIAFCVCLLIFITNPAVVRPLQLGVPRLLGLGSCSTGGVLRAEQLGCGAAVAALRRNRVRSARRHQHRNGARQEIKMNAIGMCLSVSVNIEQFQFSKKKVESRCFSKLIHPVLKH